MSTQRQPATGARRPSPAVYRRRRLVALLVVLIVLALVAWGVSAVVNALGGSDGEAAGSSAAGESGGGAPAATADTATEEAAEAATEAPAGTAPTACQTSDLELDLDLDPAEPAAGEALDVRLSLTNTGSVPCLLDAGPAGLAVTVSSGQDTVWTTEHCAPEASAEVLLDTEASHETVVRWPGTRSAAGCAGDQPAAGSGTYRVSAGLVAAPRSADESLVFTLD